MGLKIIKAGILDTVQDLGRYGYQHLGINPGGAMDRFAAQAANILAGNDIHEAVIEIHFPSSVFLFDKATTITIGGADFSAAINGEPIPVWHPVIVNKNSILQFQKWRSGARCYLAIKEKLNIPKWLNSYSTNLKAACGGFYGRAFQKNDMIAFKESHEYGNIFKDKDHIVLPWKAGVHADLKNNKIAVLPGNEWEWLTEESRQKFFHQPFTLSASADRMGYRLNGSLVSLKKEELISSAVSFGTIQLLPNGGLIVLMADHQTTGGYPRVAHVVTAHFSLLAQKRPGEEIYFQLTDLKQAEELFLQQQQHLLQLQNACKFKLQEFLDKKNGD